MTALLATTHGMLRFGALKSVLNEQTVARSSVVGINLIGSVIRLRLLF